MHHFPQINSEVCLALWEDQVQPWIEAEYGEAFSHFNRTLPKPMGPNWHSSGASEIFQTFGTSYLATSPDLNVMDVSM